MGDSTTTAPTRHLRLWQKTKPQAPRNPHPGGLILQLSDPPKYETVWDGGALAEKRMVQMFAEEVSQDETIILHNRRVPDSWNNIDHLAVTPSGVYVIKSRSFPGDNVTVFKPWDTPPRLLISDYDQTKSVGDLSRRVQLVQDALIPEVPVYGVFCLLDVNWGLFPKPLVINGIQILKPKDLIKELNSSGQLTEEHIVPIADVLNKRFPCYAR